VSTTCKNFVTFLLLKVRLTANSILVFDWFHRALADLLVRCAGGDPDVPNLLISSPPGSGKTELVSILFPAYIFARDQGSAAGKF
jgi:hypothetical protein